MYGGLVILAVAVFGLFLRGGSSAPANAALAGHRVAAATHRHSRHHVAKHARTSHARSRHAARHVRHSSRRHVAAKSPRVHHARGFLEQRAYARHILPLLDMSVHTFNRAVSATSAAGFSQLGSTCGNFNQQVDLLQQQYSGIPYSRAWYTRIGTMHHWIEGTYHTMQGALQQCQTAVSNGDYGAAATAKSDMASAAGQMQQKDAHVRWLAHRR